MVRIPLTHTRCLFAGRSLCGDRHPPGEKLGSDSFEALMSRRKIDGHRRLASVSLGEMTKALIDLSETPGTFRLCDFVVHGPVTLPSRFRFMSLKPIGAVEEAPHLAGKDPV